MRIVLDAQALLEPLAGIGHVVSNLIQALAATDGTDDFRLYYGASLRQRKDLLPKFEYPNFHPFLIRQPGKLFRPLTQRFSLPVGWHFRGTELFHGLNYYVPAGLPCPALVNIYDMSYKLLPECFTPRRLKDVSRKVSRALRYADRIATGSESSRRDIVRLLGVEPARVSVIPYGVSGQFRPVSDRTELERVRKKYGLPEHYVLTVGTIEPRKNLPFLARAFARARLEQAALVACGQMGWGSKLQIDPRAFRLEHHVLTTGYVAEEDLPAIYSGARFFAYPSLYEGFGLPPLEAMACGVPVVSSNTSSLPEVVGDAGLLLDPKDEEAWAVAMRTLWHDEGRRDLMSRAGVVRAKGFSWRRCAEATLELYRDAVHKRKEKSR